MGIEIWKKMQGRGRDIKITPALLIGGFCPEWHCVEYTGGGEGCQECYSA